MRVSMDTTQWQNALKALGKENAIKAGIRAVNRTANNAKTAMVRVIAADMGLQSKAVRDKITVQVAKNTGQAPAGYLYADSKRVPLIEFKARGPEPSRGRGRGVKAKLKGGAGVYPRAFIATMRSGHRGVFERNTAIRARKGQASGSPALGIHELYGPSIAQSFNTNSAVAQDRASEMLSKNMASEVKFMLSQAQQ